MPDSAAEPTTGGAIVRAALVAAASCVLGVLTLYAQSLLPDALASFANSASGWTLLTVLLVLWSRFRTLPAAVLGAISFVLLVWGYTAGAMMSGLHYNPAFFSVIGVLAGPFVGVASSWLREQRVRAAAGTALLAGIGLGEAFDGLTALTASTSPVYWTLIGALAASLLVGMLIRRIRGVVPIAVALVGTAGTAAALALAYRGLALLPVG